MAADPRAAATSRGTGISISSMKWHRGGHHTHLLCQNVAAEPRASLSLRRTGSSITEVIRRKWRREATDFTQIETGRGVNPGLTPHIFKGTEGRGSTIGKCPTRTVQYHWIPQA